MRKDVYLFDTENGGDVTPDLETRDGLESAVYLSLFGGNVKDDGREQNEFQWWGNLSENEENKKYRSTAAYLLRTVPPSPKNLRRIENAAKNDLEWFLKAGFTQEIFVTATMPKLNQVKLTVAMEGIDPLEFRSDWGSPEDFVPSIAVPTPIVLVNNGENLSGTGLPNAYLIFVDSNGNTIELLIGEDGTWSISPYPLEMGQIGRIYVETRTGLTSKVVVITGVAALLYNGDVYYDGSQEYDGIRTV